MDGHCLSCFLCRSDKIPTKSNLGKERVYLALRSILEGNQGRSRSREPGGMFWLVRLAFW